MDRQSTLEIISDPPHLRGSLLDLITSVKGLVKARSARIYGHDTATRLAMDQIPRARPAPRQMMTIRTAARAQDIRVMAICSLDRIDICAGAVNDYLQARPFTVGSKSRDLASRQLTNGSGILSRLVGTCEKLRLDGNVIASDEHLRARGLCGHLRARMQAQLAKARPLLPLRHIWCRVLRSINHENRRRRWKTQCRPHSCTD